MTFFLTHGGKRGREKCIEKVRPCKTGVPNRSVAIYQSIVKVILVDSGQLISELPLLRAGERGSGHRDEMEERGPRSISAPCPGCISFARGGGVVPNCFTAAESPLSENWRGHSNFFF